MPEIKAATKEGSGGNVVNINKDNAMHGNGITGNAGSGKVSLAKTAQTRVASGAVNAMHGIDVHGNASGGKKAWHEGTCEYCSEPFQKKTTWQRFCCTEHQALAYEQRTGRKWHGKTKK